MSLSVSCNSQGSITYCDEPESDDDLTQEAATKTVSCKGKRRHSSFLSGEHHFRTSTPRFLHSQSFGKENDSRRGGNEKRRKTRALNTVCSENQSVHQSDAKSATAEKKRERKKTNRATLSFDIYRQGVGDSEEKSFNDFDQYSSPVKGPHGFQVPARQASPEYDPIKHESYEEMRNSVCTSENQVQQLLEMFPDVDSEFLKSKSEQMKAPINDIIDSILFEMEKNEVPARVKIQDTKEEKKFSIDHLLKVLPDPWKYFSDKGRDCTGYLDHSLHYLKMNFRKFYNQTITDALLFHNQNLYLASKYLKKKNRGLKFRMTNRPMSECNSCKPTTVNLQFELEVSFIEHEEQVKNYVKAQVAAKKFRLREAARLHLLVECECCFGENFLPEDVVTCSAGHIFCKECITRYIEIGIGNGIGQLQCLGPCNNEYPLQDMLRPEMFSKLMETVDSSDYPNVTQCPFCHYFLYMPTACNVSKCLNVKCLQEFCRVCKSANHEPGKCEVISASGRCWQCKKEIRKENGCNELVCSCGGKTCHVCAQPVKNHSHFCLYEDGTKCPLYSTNYSA